MATDSQGRPLSDDGQWAWNGTEWVPAAAGAPAAQGSSVEADPGATMIAPSPLAAGAQPAAQQQPAYGGAPGYAAAPGGAAPAYGAPGGPPASYGVPPQQPRSKKPIIIAIIGVLVIAAVVVTLVLTLGGNNETSSAKPAGDYKCTVAGQSGSGTITFNDGGGYQLSDGGKSGKWHIDGKNITFTDGSLNKATAVYDKAAKTVTITFSGEKLDCKQ
jgi:hypothetical protein